jgi:hypothetical protein
VIRLPQFDELTQRYAQMGAEPLTVTAQLLPNSTVVNYDSLNLDALLAWVVVHLAMNGGGLETSTEPYWTPLPLEMFWQEETGLPLWCSSAFFPVGDHDRDVIVNHKYAGMQFSRTKGIRTTVGRWQSRQKAFPVMVCDRLEARCIGNAEEIGRLLSYIDVIGKRRASGSGAPVTEWIVEPAEWTHEDVFVRDGNLARPVPDGCGIRGAGLPTLLGWTPPYWLPSAFRPGWAAGT